MKHSSGLIGTGMLLGGLLGDYEQALEHLRSAVSSPENNFGALALLSMLRTNLFDDPALAGPVFQGVLSALGHP